MKTGTKVGLGLVALGLVLLSPSSSRRRRSVRCVQTTREPGTHLTPGAQHDPPVSDLTKVLSRSSRKGYVYLHPLAAAAYLDLVELARQAGIPSPILDINSGFRTSQEQNVLWQNKLQRVREQNPAWPESEVVRFTRKWVAPPGSSHETGLAIDFNLGYRYTGANIPNMEQSPAYRFLVKYANNFGFYNYNVEPWHWVYNPICDGDRFRV
jgi:LAS superfamily LD-carboxypeptidase LdcB